MTLIASLTISALCHWPVTIHRIVVEFEINNPRRVCAFLATLIHESHGFTDFEEHIQDPTVYDGRFGNVNPGDGARYAGKGPGMITFRWNYLKVGQLIGVDLVNNPKLLLRLDIGLLSAAAFWKMRGCNELADTGNFRAVTKRYSGGLKGIKGREVIYNKLMEYWR
jgi:putative chitinase